MFEIKKFIAFTLNPLTIGLFLSVISILFLLKKKKEKTSKIILVCSIFIIFISGLSWLPTLLLSSLENRYHSLSNSEIKTLQNDTLTPIKWIVVLGGGILSNPSLPASSQLSDLTIYRLIEGIRIQRLFSQSKLLLCGGKVFNKVAESNIMAQTAKELGVNENIIILDTISKQTSEQAVITKNIVKNDKFILITSASHLPRSMAMFKKQGLNPIPHPSGHKLVKNNLNYYNLLIPKSYSLFLLENALYEYFSWINAWIEGTI